LRTKPIATHIAIVAGEGVKSLWVDAVPHLITGDIKRFAKAAEVSPIDIPGYWIDKKGLNIPIDAPPAKDEKVVYYLHGGGYIAGSAHPDDRLSLIPRGVLQYCHFIRRAFTIEYRLSVGEPYTPQNPFPAALMDALAGYDYLITVVGFAPADIVVVGDSAGGNLALALTRYLVENKDVQGVNIPAPPGALVLLSPWTDLSHSHCTPGSSGVSFGRTDYVLDMRTGVAEYACRAFLGPHGVEAAEKSRYISPSCLYPSMEEFSFEGFPRTFISAGGGERLLDQIQVLRRKMVSSMGEQVMYDEPRDVVHDYIPIPFHKMEATDTLQKIAAWLEPK
jgi:acetyl esterase/lipase